MDIENMKNMVVLKNLPSNLIEEAFVILKDNVNIHKEELAVNKSKANKEKNNRDYVIKEAEVIVSEYISNLERKEFKTSKEKVKLEEKCKKLKYLSIFFGVFSMLSIIATILK